MKTAVFLITFFFAFVVSGAEKFDPLASTTAVEFARASGAARISPDLLIPSRDPFRLGPGDKVEIEILGGDATRRNSLVGPDGMLYYDLLPGFEASGLTLEELRLLLEKKLGDFYRFPRVSVVAAEVRSKRVWVLGRVNKPGVYPLVRPTTVLDAISQSGGLFTSRFSGTTEELADLDHSFVMRGRKMMPVNFQRLIRGGDMAQNIQLQPGDYLYLPSSLAKEIHVLGAVKEPRAVGFTQEMSLSSAIGSALGVIKGADLKRVAIVRGTLTEPKIAIVDFEAIQGGRAPNVRLEPRDIVYVPTGRFRTLSDLADAVANTFVRTVGANEGSRAAIPKSEPIRPQLNLTE